jgi:hypothetical protein
MSEKRRRPGKGPIPRGARQAAKEAAHARRLAALASSDPNTRSESRLPSSGSADFLARFWARIETADAESCWLWTGRIDRRSDQGYGVLSVLNRPERAHRLAYELHHAVHLGSDDFVCHRCDNPPCCNPAHLFVGTVTDNNRDATAKGRHHHGSKTHCHRGHALTPDNLCPDKRNVRKCRACARLLAMKGYHLRRGEPEKAAAFA